MTGIIQIQIEEQSGALYTDDIIPPEFAKPRTSITLSFLSKKGSYMVRRRNIQRSNIKTNIHTLRTTQA